MPEQLSLEEKLKAIHEALTFCLTNVEINGCPSPGLFEQALTDLDKLSKDLSYLPVVTYA